MNTQKMSDNVLDIHPGSRSDVSAHGATKQSPRQPSPVVSTHLGVDALVTPELAPSHASMVLMPRSRVPSLTGLTPVGDTVKVPRPWMVKIVTTCLQQLTRLRHPQALPGRWDDLLWSADLWAQGKASMLGSYRELGKIRRRQRTLAPASLWANAWNIRMSDTDFSRTVTPQIEKFVFDMYAALNDAHRCLRRSPSSFARQQRVNMLAGRYIAWLCLTKDDVEKGEIPDEATLQKRLRHSICSMTHADRAATRLHHDSYRTFESVRLSDPGLYEAAFTTMRYLTQSVALLGHNTAGSFYAGYMQEIDGLMPLRSSIELLPSWAR